MKLSLFLILIRQKSMLLATILMLSIGFYAIYSGQAEARKKQENIAFIQKQQKHQHQTYAQYNHDDIGLLMYYLKFGLCYQQPQISALGFAQDKDFLAPMQLNIRNLEAQKYDTDIQNPVQRAIGNLDLSFVIIYLLPLYIIILGFNFYPEEKASGRWVFASILAPKPQQILLQKAQVLYLILLAMLFIWMLTAYIWLDFSLMSGFLYTLASALYLFFWLMTMLVINLWARQALFNLNLGLGLWLGLLILLPALIQNYTQYAYPVPEALETVYTQRNAYHHKWDLDKNITMQKFYAHYPQFRKYALPDKTFSWTWYYAMQDMGDYESRPQSQAFAEKIKNRHHFFQQNTGFLPNLALQNIYNQLGDHGLEAKLKFWEESQKFHEALKQKFYPMIFENKAVDSYAWGQDQVKVLPIQSNNTTKTPWILLIGLNILLSLGLLSIQKTKK